MASRRSHAASHSINQRRVPMGHVFIRNPLQAPKERSCGTSITSPSHGSAKRDRLSSSTSSWMHQSPFGELLFGGHMHPTAALLRSLQWVSDRYVSHRDTAQLILSYNNGGRQWYKVTYYSQPPKYRKGTTSSRTNLGGYGVSP